MKLEFLLFWDIHKRLKGAFSEVYGRIIDINGIPYISLGLMQPLDAVGGRSSLLLHFYGAATSDIGDFLASTLVPT
jgi:hypothetical protein